MVAVSLQPEVVSVDPSPSAVPLSLAPGTELLGQYEASAFSQPQYMLRRPDGQIIQLTRLLYLVAAALDGNRQAAAVSTEVSAQFGRPVSADNINYLVVNKLRPLGVVATGTGGAPLTRAAPGALGLRFRARVVPERFHRYISSALRPLFWTPLVLAILIAFVGFDTWLFATQASTVLRGMQEVILHPDQLLVIIAICIVVGAFHEIGHATAARYGGAKPGVMGVGIYLMLPVFYTDVTDSYRLNRRGRLRTDLGGLYFNVIAILVAAGLYQLTHLALLLVFIGLSELEMLYQFLPFVRMDGYYVVSDLIGVPNLFAFVGPTIGRLLHRDNGERDRLGLLKPRARHAIMVWVALTVPILALNAVLLAVSADRIFPAMWESWRIQATGLVTAVPRSDVVGAANHVVELVLASVPIVGFVLLVGALLHRRAVLIVRATRRRLGQVREASRALLDRRATLVVVGVVIVLAPLALLTVDLEASPQSVPSPQALAQPAAIPAAAPSAGTATTPTVPTAVPSRPAATVAARPVTVSVPISGMTVATPDGRGYWQVKADGAVSAFGDARLYGSEAGHHLDQPMVAITTTPDGHGYTLVAADGGVFTFGDAHFYGSRAGHPLNQPVVAATTTPDGHGYTLVAAHGGTFRFGDAGQDGRAPPKALARSVAGGGAAPLGAHR